MGDVINMLENSKLIDRVVKYTIFGIVLFVPFMFTPFSELYDFFYYPKYMSLVIITVFLLISVLLNFKQITRLFKFDLINKLLLIYFLFITLSLFFSLDPLLSIQGRPLRYDGYTTQLIYIILFLFARTIKSIDKRFIYAVSFVTTLLSLYGMIQYLGLDPFPRDLIRLNWTSAFSTFGNQNFFGSFLVLQIPFNLYIIAVYKNKWAYIPYGISLVALLMTSTRSAWIGFIVSFILILILTYKQNNQYKQIIIFSIVIVVLFNLFDNNQLLNRFMTILSDLKILSSTSYTENPKAIEQVGSVRMFIWIRVIELIKMRPLFGFGIENLAIAFEKYYYNDIISINGSYAIIDKAHNDFLHIAVSSGIISLISYLTFVLTILISSFKRISKDLNIVFISSIIGYLACLFFNISVVSVTYIFWIYLGLMCKYNHSNSSEEILQEIA